MKLDDFSKQLVTSVNNNEQAEIRFVWEQLDFVPWSKVGLFRHLFAGKNLINLECGDHGIARFQQKLRDNEWLHGHLLEVAASVIGIDRNQETVTHINSMVSSQVYCLDAIKDQHPVLNLRYDVLLIPDALEHQTDPVGFLSAINKRYRDTIDQIFVTVPNTLSRKNIKRSRSGREVVNAGHNFVFTHFSLAKCLSLSGFDCLSFYMMNDILDTKLYPAQRLVLMSSLGRLLWQRNLLNQNRIGVRARFIAKPAR